MELKGWKARVVLIAACITVINYILVTGIVIGSLFVH